MRYQWPDNIRELENALEHAIVLGSSNTILPNDLPEAIVEIGSPALPLNAHYHAAITDFKKQLVREAFRQAKGSYLEAAKNLGMHPNSLLRLIRSLDLRSDYKPDETFDSRVSGFSSARDGAGGFGQRL